MSLDYVGYRKLRTGRIHLFCPGCGRKASNMPRGKYDPPRAVLAHVFCERCSNGSKVDGCSDYLTATGRFMWWDDRREEYR